MGALYKGTSGLIKSPTGTDIDNRLVRGYYTNDKIDLHGHIIEREAMEKALPEYREWGTVREMHEHAIGTTVEIGTVEWNWISTRVANTVRGTEVLANVQEGVYKAFSVGIIVTNGHFVHVDELNDEDFNQISQDMAELIREYEYVFKITGLTLIENSIVDRPANPAARVKALVNSRDVQVDGYLPSIDKVQGNDVIKSVLPRDKFFVSNGLHTHLVEAMGAGMEDQNIPASDETKTSVEDNDMTDKQVEDVVTKEVSEESEEELGTADAEPTEVENEPEVTEEPEVEVEAEVEADVEAESEVEVEAEADVEVGDVVEDEAPVDPFSESFDKVIAGQEATITAIETLSATIEDLVLTLTATTVEADDEEEVVEAAAEVEEESEDVEKSIESDETPLADPVTDKPSEKIAERKGTVNTEGIEKEGDAEEDAVPTTKTLDRIELRKQMAAAAVIRAKR